MAIQIASNQLKNGAVTASQIADSTIGAGKLNLADNFTFSGYLRAGTPSNAADVATKSYVDGIIGSGVYWKEPAQVASTANVNLANPGTSTFDNVVISSGARVLIHQQSSASENGIYVFNGSSSAMTRATDCDTAAEINGASLFVTDGDTYADQAFVQTATISTLGSDSVSWVRFSGLGQVTAGDGLAKSGDTLSVNVDGVSLEIVSDALQVASGGISNDMLAGSISSDKLAGNIGDSLLSTISTAGKVAGSSVQLNGSGGLANSTGLKIADLGVTNGMLAGSISDAKLSQITTADKVAGSAVQLAAGGGLQDSTGLGIAATSVTDGMLAGSISATKLAGSIPDSKLNQITTASKVAGSAVQLKSGGALENSTGLTVKQDGIVSAMIADDAVSSAKLDFEPFRETLSTNGSTTAFSLSASVPDGFDDVFVFRNGLFLDRVAANPSGVDEFTSSINAGTCTVTFGAAPSGSDKVVVKYFALK